ncbi:MAG: DNA cytosine methyltransferase [Luteolibacter sp.]
MRKSENKVIPVIDLFAGPGGLGEGFTQAGFEIRLSIECDTQAHQTLQFRAFFRELMKNVKGGCAINEFFSSGANIEELFSAFPDQAEHARDESWCARLGSTPDREVDDRIDKALQGSKKWALIGGPPCQAYSLVGRARMRGSKSDFEDDHRHFLYKEYLRIVEKHRPTVFVMENVKGILSANVKETAIFAQILSDLRAPTKALKCRSSSNGEVEYELHSIAVSSDTLGKDFEPKQFLVRAEEFGIPQRRHRIFIVGIRKGTGIKMNYLKPSGSFTTVGDVIGDLPKLRSGFSRNVGGDWVTAIDGMRNQPWFRSMVKGDPELGQMLDFELRQLRQMQNNGSNIASVRNRSKAKKLDEWYGKINLPYILNHECRNHMASDLQRYFYAACYSKVHHKSPKISDFPPALWPAHKNVHNTDKKVIFDDRFRVQCENGPSTTVVSHISKDGHYYIHPDPRQCRSMTVREAARLQTFPDDYFFTGPRTAQFHQVGNAVPPYLAYQIATALKKSLSAK